MKKITLPQHDDMLRRLHSVSNDIEALETDFYPFILKRAGASRTAAGVVMILQLALIEFENRQSHEALIMLLNLTEDYVKALVDDKQVQEHVLELAAEMKREILH